MKRSFVLLFAVALTGALAAASIEAESGTLAPNGAKITFHIPGQEEDQPDRRSGGSRAVYKQIRQGVRFRGG